MSRGAYRGLDEIAEFEPGDRVTVMIEATIEDLSIIKPMTGGLEEYAFAMQFGGGSTLEFPTQSEGQRHDVQITVRRKKVHP